MGELVFVGMGLRDESDVSLRGLEEARTADYVFAELYTSLMEGLDIEKLARLTGKRIVPVSRRMLEEESGMEIMEAAQKGKTVLLVPGDPLIATTHVDLRIRATKAGVKVRIVHGASIISAAIGLSGLQNYKFGRSVTIPFVEKGAASETPLNVIKRNLAAGLHTLCFLDIKAEQKQYMTIKEALETLLRVVNGKSNPAVTRDGIAVGIARAGSRNPVVKAGMLKELVGYDFGNPPHTLVFPGKLHFMEAEALIVLADAPESVRKMVE
ncbi:MAG: diphthine synthase [Candidatus Bathyarchaeia archaeon]